MLTFAAVAIGGALGAVLRHAVNLASLRWLGWGFPWGTFVENVLGCFLMGIAAAVFAAKAELAFRAVRQSCREIAATMMSREAVKRSANELTR